MDESEVRNIVCDQNLRPNIGAKTNAVLASTIRSCWHRKPENRPTIDEIQMELEKAEFSCINTAVSGGTARRSSRSSGLNNESGSFYISFRE